jgi:hypothetical protein
MNFNQSLYDLEQDYLALPGESRDHVVEHEGSKCELRTYESHLNSRIALQVGTKKKNQVQQSVRNRLSPCSDQVLQRRRRSQSAGL